MFHLWYERLMDQELHIQTQVMREWSEIEDMLIYNRLESTPYQALDKLFEYKELKADSNFVDFGCGSGRVAFYVHNRFNLPVTGIELNNSTYFDLINNFHSYLEAKPKVDFVGKDLKLAEIESKKTTLRNRERVAQTSQIEAAPLNFIQAYAESYQVMPEQNVFYFFNPFTISIFAQVIRNIEQSLFDHPRSAELILYYPMYEYQYFIEKQTIFSREGSIRLDMLDDEFEKFVVYRYEL